MKPYNFRFIDLLCGIGGFHQAMTPLGGRCVFASDINEQFRDVYMKGIDHSYYYESYTTFKTEKL